MRVLGNLIQACFVSHGMASTADGEFSIIHCNNQDSMEPEMKIQISKRFFEMNIGSTASWGSGFEESENGFEKVLLSTELTLELNENDDCK